MHRTLGLVALILWVLTLTIIGWFFVRGWTASGSDGRTEIILAPSERDLVLKEMRELLKAVDRVIRELGSPQPDRQAAQAAARAVGMAMAADVNPAIMAKLPLSFKQIGMSIHQDMDVLADAIHQDETPQQVLQRLGHMTAFGITSKGDSTILQ